LATTAIDYVIYYYTLVHVYILYCGQIIFTEALLHGTLPWRACHDRLTLFYKFSPHGSAHNATFFNPEQFAALYPDLTARQLALLEPPAAYRRALEADWEWRRAELRQDSEARQLPRL